MAVLFQRNAAISISVRPADCFESAFRETRGQAVRPVSRSATTVARAIRRALAEGHVVDIDGLGVFSPDARRGFRFEPRDLPQVFLSYAKEDAGLANQLYYLIERGIHIGRWEFKQAIERR